MADISKIRILNTDYDIKDETARNIIDKQIYSFGTLNEMTSSTLLKNGDFAKTLGFYEINDGGSANYYIRTKTNNEVVNNITLFEITNDLVAELVFKDTLNYLQIGGKINDNSYDATNLIQNAINILENKNQGKLILPSGKIYITGTITLKQNVEIIGFNDYSTWNGNASIENNGTIIYHIPITACNLFNVDNINLSNGYLPNIVLKNLYIIGNSYSTIALNLTKVAKSIFENLMIKNFQTNILIDYCMENDFINIFSQMAYSNCLLIQKLIGLNTSQNFQNCYFGQTRWEWSTGYPLKIENDAIENANFINCLFESSNKSITIGNGNIINFENIYVENIPATQNVPTFDIGKTASTVNGIINVTNGFILGSIDEPNTSNHTIFDLNYIDALKIDGVYVANSGKLLNTTSNTGNIICNNIIEKNVSNNILPFINSNNVSWFNYQNIDHPTLHYYLPRQNLNYAQLTNYENNWESYSNGCRYTKIGNLVYLELSLKAGTTASLTQILGALPNDIRPNVPIFCELRNVSNLIDNNTKVVIDTDIKVPNSSANNFVSGDIYQGAITYMVN